MELEALSAKQEAPTSIHAVNALENKLREVVKILTGTNLDAEGVLASVQILRSVFTHTTVIRNKLLKHTDEEIIEYINKLKTLTQNQALKLNSQKATLTQLQEVVNQKNSISNRYKADYDYLKARVIKCYGHEGYITLMATTECPGGFDIAQYKRQHGLRFSQ